MTRLILASAAALLTALPALADPPDIVSVTASKSAMGWRFEVTIRHDDTGWDNYASGWEIVDKHGERYAYRELVHPHVNEQPFTRSLTSVLLPDGTRKVYIVAHSSDGSKSEPYPVKLKFKY